MWHIAKCRRVDRAQGKVHRDKLTNKQPVFGSSVLHKPTSFLGGHAEGNGEKISN